MSESQAEKRLTTYMMLAHFMKEQEHPSQTELRLTRDGWEVRSGELEQPVPLHVDHAYEMSGFDQRVLDETRKLCGQLRIPAKRNKVMQQQLDDLRSGLRRAQAIKAARATDRDLADREDAR